MEMPMKKPANRTTLTRRGLVGGLVLMAVTEPAWAVLGHWRRVARRTTVVVASTAGAEAAAAEQQQQAAAANSAKASADASAAAAQQSAAAAQQAEAQAKAAAAPKAKTPQEKLKELQSLYDQKLISQADYEAAKQKVLSEMTQ
jgi:hypothetical protein